MRLNNKGITVVMLVITIVVMLIMTSLAVFYSTNIAPEARIAAAFSSLREIKNACNRALNEVNLDPIEYDEYYFFGKSVQIERPTEVEDLQTRCGLSGASGDCFSDRTYMIYATYKDDPHEVEMRRRVEKLEITNLGKYEFIADLGNNKYYVVDGVERIDNNNPANNKKAFEYRDIEMLYSMITDTKKR